MSREWPSPDTCLASALALASQPAGPWEGTLRRMSRPFRGSVTAARRDCDTDSLPFRINNSHVVSLAVYFKK